MPEPKRMPVIFLGHGNPMNALDDNVYTRGWSALGAELPRPQAVLSISAHWYVPVTAEFSEEEASALIDLVLARARAFKTGA